jgi:hypothetical protein
MTAGDISQNRKWGIELAFEANEELDAQTQQAWYQL